MKKIKKAVCGLFSTRASAQKTIDSLVANGFQSQNIHILIKQKEGEHNFIHGLPMNTRFGAAIGALVGLVLLGCVGFFLSSSLSLNDPAPSPFLSMLMGAFVGILVGGASGALAGNGIPKMTNNRYGYYLKQGGLLLTLHIDEDDDEQKAADIFKSSGAQDVSDLYDGEIWELAQTV